MTYMTTNRPHPMIPADLPHTLLTLPIREVRCGPFTLNYAVRVLGDQPGFELLERDQFGRHVSPPRYAASVYECDDLLRAYHGVGFNEVTLLYLADVTGRAWRRSVWMLADLQRNYRHAQALAEDLTDHPDFDAAFDGDTAYELARDEYLTLCAEIAHQEAVLRVEITKTNIGCRLLKLTQWWTTEGYWN